MRIKENKVLMLCKMIQSPFDRTQKSSNVFYFSFIALLFYRMLNNIKYENY